MYGISPITKCVPSKEFVFKAYSCPPKIVFEVRLQHCISCSYLLTYELATKQWSRQICCDLANNKHKLTYTHIHVCTCIYMYMYIGVCMTTEQGKNTKFIEKYVCICILMYICTYVCMYAPQHIKVKQLQYTGENSSFTHYL